MIGILAVTLSWIISTAAIAQVIGDDAEMERLRAKAEEAIENGDSDGAAMNMGKAALMAVQLAKKPENSSQAQWYRGAESLFRAQEQAYRAQALFERAGGQTPASSGVCGSMRLAKQHLDKSVSLLVDAAASADHRSKQLEATAVGWGKTLEGMNADFQCQ